MTKTKIGTANVVDGEATLEWTIPSTIKIGTSTIYGTYIENSVYMMGEAYNTIEVRVGTTITVDNVLASKGESATFTAHVRHSTNQNVNEGTVQFQLGGSNIGTPVNVSNGVANLSYTIPSSGVNSGAEIRAYFLETNTYGASTSNAGVLTLRKGTNVTLSNISANRSEEITISAQITDSNGDNVNTGTAKLLIDNTQITTVSVSNAGVASFDYTVANNAILGSHTIKIQYEQNSSYDAGEGTATLTVRTPTTLSPVNVSANAGSSIPVTIRVVDPNNTPIPTGTINITVGEGTPVSATVNVSGEATIQYNVPANATGTIQFSGVYIQDNNYQGSSTSSAGIITIRQATSVVVDSKKANVGDTINLTATVTSGQTMVDEGTLDFEVE